MLSGPSVFSVSTVWERQVKNRSRILIEVLPWDLANPVFGEKSELRHINLYFLLFFVCLFCFIHRGMSNSNRSPEMAFHIFPSSFSSSSPPQDRRKLALWLTFQPHVHWDTSAILHRANAVNLADDSWAKELIDLSADEFIPKPIHDSSRCSDFTELYLSSSDSKANQDPMEIF